MGNQYRRGDCSDSKGRDLGDLSKPVARDGLVQYEASKGIGVHLSTDGNKQKVGLSPFNGRHLRNDVEPVVVLFNQRAKPGGGEEDSLAIRFAVLPDPGAMRGGYERVAIRKML